MSGFRSPVKRACYKTWHFKTLHFNAANVLLQHKWQLPARPLHTSKEISPEVREAVKILIDNHVDTFQKVAPDEWHIKLDPAFGHNEFHNTQKFLYPAGKRDKSSDDDQNTLSAAQIKEMLASFKERDARNEASLKERDARNEKLEARIDEVLADNKKLKARNEKLEARIDEVLADNKKLKAEIKALQEANKELNARITSLEYEVGELKTHMGRPISRYILAILIAETHTLMVSSRITLDSPKWQEQRWDLITKACRATVKKSQRKIQGNGHTDPVNKKQNVVKKWTEGFKVFGAPLEHLYSRELFAERNTGAHSASLGFMHLCLKDDPLYGEIWFKLTGISAGTEFPQEWRDQVAHNEWFEDEE